MDQPNPENKSQHTVDAGILEVAIALASLSVGIVALPLQIPDLVISKWFNIPIVGLGIIAFFFSYLALGDLFLMYMKERGKEFRGIVFGRERPVFRWDPHWEVGLAIRFFGLSLLFLVAGILLNWIKTWIM